MSETFLKSKVCVKLHNRSRGGDPRGADGSFKDWTIYKETGLSPGEVELSASQRHFRGISGYYLVSLLCPNSTGIF